jgi:integrase
MTNYFSEMRLFDDDGSRLYLTETERGKFLDSAKIESRENRVFCEVLHYTGCRISEALELSPKKILNGEQSIIFRNLKKRKYNKAGKKNLPSFRSVPVETRVLEMIDLVFDLKSKKIDPDSLFWTMSRTTAWRMIKRVMTRAEIEGPQAKPKGLRHGFGIAMVSGEKPLPLHLLAQIMGHSSTVTTEIYTKAVEGEKQKMVLRAWKQ